MNKSKPYLLDTNILIEAKNAYYAFSICPGFWESLLWMHREQLVDSIDHVREELLRQKDELADWTKQALPTTFFHDSGAPEVDAAYREIMAWLGGSAQFSKTAKSDFAASADGWLIAFAKVKKYVLVTHEEHAPLVKRKVPIPNVCIRFDVPYTDTFQMLKATHMKFHWSA